VLKGLFAESHSACCFAPPCACARVLEWRHCTVRSPHRLKDLALHWTDGWFTKNLFFLIRAKVLKRGKLILHVIIYLFIFFLKFWERAICV